jgi:hypothetical protein
MSPASYRTAPPRITRLAGIHVGDNPRAGWERTPRRVGTTRFELTYRNSIGLIVISGATQVVVGRTPTLHQGHLDIGRIRSRTPVRSSVEDRFIPYIERRFDEPLFLEILDDGVGR